MDARTLRVDEIAVTMGMSVPALWQFARNLEHHFKPTRKQQIKGKARDIDPPKPYAKKVLRRLHRFLQRHFPPCRLVHGGAKGRSCFTAARRHRGRSFLITRDVQDCYPSITREALATQLRKYGFRGDVALVLSLLFTVRGRVAQGSPVSSDALNFLLFDADRSMGSVCGAVKARYGRTYDDMVVSVNSREPVNRLGRLVENAIRDHGLVVNIRKRKEHGLQPRHNIQRVHNIVVNSKRGVRIPKDQGQSAIDLAESYVRGAKVVTADSLEALAYKRKRVFGWMCHCSQADFSPAKPLRKLLEQGDRIVGRRLRQQGLSPHKGKWWVVVHKSRNEPRRLANRWRARLSGGAARW